jgi:M6 family metalloprotease-like protein
MMPECLVGLHWRGIYVYNHKGKNVIKKVLLIAVCILLLTTSLYAAPAAPHLHDLQQPDGTSVAARQWGDEHSHGWETDSRHTIVFDKKIKAWAYAVHDNQGKLASSSVLVKRSVAPPAGTQKSLRPLKSSSLSAVSTSVNATSPSGSSVQQASPVTGTKSFPVILIGFKDVSFTKTKADFDNLLFGDTGNTMKNYYLENSYNQLTVNGGFFGVFGPVTSNQVRTYYGANATDGLDSFAGTLVYEAVSKAAAGGLKFAPFVDQSKSCYVDVVAVVHQGTGEESGFDANDIWSNTWSLNDAKYYGNSSAGEFVTSETCSYPGGGGYIKVNNYTIQPELAVPSGTMIGAGVFAHEFGHSLGLPDLYDTDDSSNGAGYWSLMASGMWLGKTIGYGHNTYSIGETPSHLDIWSKYYLGWIGPASVSGINANISIAAASSSAPNFYKLGIGTSTTGEYFLVENRQKSGFDSYLPGSGLLVWHIDGTTITNLMEGNSINNNECILTEPGACAGSATHYGVALIQADNQLHLEKNSGDGDANDPFYSPKNSQLSYLTSPSSRLWDGTYSGSGVTSIGASAATMTATLMGIPISPAVTTNSASDIGATSAKLHGTVNDNNANATVSFNYGLTGLYGTNAPATIGGTISAGTGTVSSSVTLSGLTCNTTYHFQVKAINSIGTSLGGDMRFTTAACVPDAPVITSVKVGNAQADIYFYPPASDGGASVTGYTVMSSIGTTQPSLYIPITVFGLSNGTQYTFTVSAVNSAGPGIPSTPSNSVIPGLVVNKDYDETGYQTMQAAYGGSHNSEIHIQANAQVGGFAKTGSDAIVLIGGYDAAFSTNSGAPSILSNLTLSGGTTRVQKVVVRSP